MANVFKEGDVVYHVKYGEGVVEKADREGAWLSCNGVTQYGFNYSLSFKPWPKPCHERPIEDGWWIVKLDDIHRLVEHKKGKLFYEWGAQIERNLEDYEFKKYLGKEL